MKTRHQYIDTMESRLAMETIHRSVVAGLVGSVLLFGGCKTYPLPENHQSREHTVYVRGLGTVDLVRADGDATVDYITAVGMSRYVVFVAPGFEQFGNKYETRRMPQDIRDAATRVMNELDKLEVRISQTADTAAVLQ